MPAKGFSITNSGRIDMFDMNKEGKKGDMFNSACEKMRMCYHLQ